MEGRVLSLSTDYTLKWSFVAVDHLEKEPKAVVLLLPNYRVRSVKKTFNVKCFLGT